MINVCSLPHPRRHGGRRIAETGGVPAAATLVETGVTVLAEQVDTADAAWRAAAPVVEAAAATDELCRRYGPLLVVADYTMPPAESPQRPFQVLHLDFGIPLDRTGRVDVARYTVLHVDAAAAASGAATRIVRLADLAPLRRWPAASELAARLRARPDDPDVTEGVLGRIVEAADGSARLPAKTSPGFRCGLEFDHLDAERRFFAEHGVDLAAVERRVVLRPGQVLVFDNLRCAHGRHGVRATGELHQRCLGFADLPAAGQRAVLHRTLAELTGA